MQTDQTADQVATGLVAPAQSEPTSQSPAAEAAPAASADVPFAQVVGLSDDVTRKVGEINQPLAVAQATQDFKLQDQLAAENENTKRTFLAKVAATRKAHEPKPYTPPEVPAQIAENTRLEMEAGRKRVSEFEEMERLRPKKAPVDDPRVGKTTSVFRPEEFDEYKSAFRSPAQTVSKDNIRQPPAR